MPHPLPAPASPRAPGAAGESGRGAGAHHGPPALHQVPALRLQLRLLGLYVLVGAGALMVTVGFFGCCGAVRESQYLLGAFFACLLVIFAAEVTAGVFAFIGKKAAVQEVQTIYEEAYKDYVMDMGKSNETLIQFHTARGKLQVTVQSSSAEVTMMESQNRKRAPAWTKREGMKDRGHNRDPKQCRVKLKELRQAYQKTREANGRSGSEPQTCRFHDELHAILGGSATTTPAVLFDSFNGDGGNMEAGFGDEEDDDDDDEVVDSSQQASGETGFPDSQELFLTLDRESVPPKPTQGCFLDPAGGEGTSAACVSMITGSSPSQRLVKIRKKKTHS
ncbi:tetraspanin-2 isoform X2 [Caretta caretta]|uniref:tetraspanin-2 isoform X2 n=1 Tax=Caretta caretta TaxID=8467 RepID=UPI003F4C6354